MEQNFTLDLSDITDESTLPVIDKEEYERLRLKAEAVKTKIRKGGDMTLEDQRDIIAFCRVDRETKFILNKSKPKKVPRERKAKKLSRVKLIELLEKDQDTLTDEEVKDRDHSLALYKGRKLSKKALNQLLIKETTTKLNPVEVIDKNLNLFGSMN